MRRALWLSASLLVFVLAADPALATLQSTSADAELGQVDFSGASCGLGARTLCAPLRMVVAPSGRLYVSDTTNNRVLSWGSAQQFSNGQAADLVLGQPGMASRGCNGTPEQRFAGQTPAAAATANGMCMPIDITVDGFGRLYVADNANSRVLRFDLPRTNGEPATLALGQPDLTTAVCDAAPAATSATSFCESATVVLGQADATSRLCNRSFDTVAPSADTVCGPQGVAVDAARHLYVADSRNNRVLRFN
jgi:hypothetical protein